MYIVTVTPISKGVWPDQLTYFSSAPVAVGALVSVPIRQKNYDALVIDTAPATGHKLELKNQDFTLKKITAVKRHRFFLPAFITACRQTADYYAITLGQTVKTALPQTILDNLAQSKAVPNGLAAKSVTSDGTVKQNKFILQDTADERLAYYKALIRESFAKKESVMLCLPTGREVEKYAGTFGPGIRDYTIVLQNDLAKKQLWLNWNKAINLDHPVLIITTPGFLALPRRDLGIIILEKENSHGYRTAGRPYLDFRRLAECLADELPARLILGDLVLRAETIFRTERGELSHLSGFKYRSLSPAAQIMLNAKNTDPSDKSVRAIGDDLSKILAETIALREKTIIFCGRRGLAPIVICSDCGELVRCRHCASPLSLHKNLAEKKYQYLCHKCGRTEATSDICPACGSWRLNLFGIGSEKAEQELSALFPATPLFRLDSDATKPAKRTAVLKKFMDTKGAAILLGTEALLARLTEKVPNVAVIALDALFALPDWRISERALSTLFFLREFAERRFIIQSRNPEEKVYRYALEGNLIDFYREEIEERMKFGYPPFKTLIKISTREESPDRARTAMAGLEELLADYAPVVFPSTHSKTKGKVRWNAIIKLPATGWPNAGLLAKLKGLSPDWEVEVEPESVL